MIIEAIEHPDHKGLMVTKDGDVYFKLNPSRSHGGYHVVAVPRRQGAPVRVRRHTLVLETYVGPALGRVARHGPNGPGDDSIENLCWGTQAENCRDTVAHGRSTRGSKNAQAKLRAEQVLDIYRRYHAGESGKSLADEFLVSQPTIVDISKRRTWAHIHTEAA